VELVTQPRIVCLGEGMVEERVAPGGALTKHYGGDTLNTAIHLARLGCDVAFATAVGSDEESDGLITAWQAEGLDCSSVLRHPTRRAGRYRIVVDELGERSFSDDRSESAAREMFALDTVDAAMAETEWTDGFCFSLVSLAILPPEGRQHLLNHAALVGSHGGMVVFDGNYRPQMWNDPTEAIAARDAAIALADIGLPTLEDETRLSGETRPEEVARHWARLGCRETVVKLGPSGCRLLDGTIVAPQQVLQPVDTSGAGDAFNAGYLVERLCGATPGEAAVRGNSLAGWTIMRAGAIPALDSEAPYA
jgi:2-dehydro-3-deoxygluconokinase